MKKRSRSTLFLMEQLIVILVFAVCTAACVKIFVDSHLTAVDSRDTRNAIIIAESAAECYKASNGDLISTALLLGAKESSDKGLIILYFDSNRQIVDVEEAVYVLELSSKVADNSTSLHVCEISVSRIGGNELFFLSVAANREVVG